ncbi:molybdopterin-dependent oxidoreductase [Actinomadura rayongensis]|uniref:Molybdopterin-dependent oxidoreductase n=2 Tax=Actinomadura rayongensis TaxID=1429076 RepID=A0A6I4W0Z8_9ACTN|nr:molybdopterin-dependent oxidoreductase [Actinomadura rayongensis]MXQ63131.1 molybdopterin-dependent oxidoreductase [Actinomadura rayongensis]
MGAAELAAGALGRPGSAPVLAVGAGFVDLTPVWLKDVAIRRFGSDDKTVLLLGLAAGIAVIAAAIGSLSRFRARRGLAGLAVLGAVGVLAALTRPTAEPWDALPSVVGTAAGMAALVLLTRTANPATGPDAAARRRVLLTGAGLTVAAVAAGAAGRLLARRGDVAGVRAGLRLPPPRGSARPVPDGAQVRAPGMPSFTTSNADFYRVDTALTLPQVDPRDWTLRIHGLVARPVELSFADLLGLPLVERDITLACVSNQVGGDLAGNARWLGAPLAGLLRRAGVRAGADQILSRGADGMTLSTPLAAVLDGRDALVAVGMNGEPLPVAHGFPARLVVPGLYGYVSATKWVVDLKVTRFATDRAYWTRRGYAERAPVKTFSRIDVPRPFARVRAGRVVVAGTAWAQHRGVVAVEWQVDDGPWRAAQLAPVPGPDTWRQWAAEWDAAPGSHTLRVRAADGTGRTQPAHRAPPFPDGATGRHSVVVTVV